MLQCFILLLPILLLFGGNITISAINQVHYGVFLTNDRTEGNFAELMSLFYHLQGNTEADSDIWISRETIARAEAVSPTLQQLQPLLDSYAEDWSTSNGEIPGDHFSWVLRDAVQDSGYSPDAVSAQTFYGSVLSELHAAVERGDLTTRQDGALYFPPNPEEYYLRKFRVSCLILCKYMEDRRLYGLCSKQLCQKHRASVGYPPDGGIYLLPGSVSYTVTVPGGRL